jgi:membrane protein
VHAVFEALEVQTQTARPWWKKRVLAIATCVALCLGTAAVALLSIGLGWLVGVVGRSLPTAFLNLGRGPIEDLFRWGAAAALAIAMTAGLYRVGIPRKDGQRIPTVPGALLSVILQALLGWAYGEYVIRLGSNSAYQAGLAVVAVTLTTLWLFSIALLLGVNLNAAIAHARSR